MNYLKEVLAFHDWLETNQCDATEQALWFHLMDINNKCGWSVWFTVANMTLQARLGGIDKKTLDRRRNSLCVKGRIEYISQGKKQAGKYRIIPFEGVIGGNNPLETGLFVTSGDLNHTPLNKLNDIDFNNPLLFPLDVTENERQILNSLHKIDGYPFDCEKDLAFIRQLAVDFPALDLFEQAKSYSTWVLDNPYTEKSNPRSQFRNWCKPKKWSKTALKAVPGGKQKKREEEKKRDWGWQS